MNCPDCGNKAAECVIGNYWTCPGVGCKNNVAKGPEVSPHAFYRLRNQDGGWDYDPDDTDPGPYTDLGPYSISSACGQCGCSVYHNVMGVDFCVACGSKWGQSP